MCFLRRRNIGLTGHLTRNPTSPCILNKIKVKSRVEKEWYFVETVASKQIIYSSLGCQLVRRLICAKIVVMPPTSSGFKLTIQTNFPNITTDRTSTQATLKVLPITVIKSSQSKHNIHSKPNFSFIVKQVEADSD